MVARKDSCLMADVTFDGNKRICWYIWDNSGNQGVRYWAAYVWNEVKQKFLFVPSFHDIPNPTLNEKEKIIESFSRGSAVDYEFGKWKFEKGVFVQKKNFYHTLRERVSSVILRSSPLHGLLGKQQLRTFSKGMDSKNRLNR